MREDRGRQESPALKQNGAITSATKGTQKARGDKEREREMKRDRRSEESTESKSNVHDENYSLTKRWTHERARGELSRISLPR